MIFIYSMRPSLRRSSSALDDDKRSNKPLSGEPEIATTVRGPGAHGSHRKALSVLDDSDRSSPSASSSSPHLEIQPRNQTAPQPSPAVSSASPHAPFFDDLHDRENSPTLHPPSTQLSGVTDPSEQNYGEDRRPSIASATTSSSQGSRSSRGGRFHKRLQGFFGDEFNGSDSLLNLQRSVSNKAPGSSRKHSNGREADHSFRFSHGLERSTSGGSRKHSPLPSSDMTSWLHSSANVSYFYPYYHT